MQRDFGSQLLSEIVFYRTYSQTLPDGRKETRAETIDRVAQMHCDRFPQWSGAIRDAFRWVHRGLCVPSMRSMQFAGPAVMRSHARIFNCCFTAIQSVRDVADAFWLLMNGCGVGYSVQRRHVDQMPPVPVGQMGARFVVPDSKEGWALSVLELFQNPQVVFDYSLVRPTGAPLSTGGTASGPQPLLKAHEAIRGLLNRAVGRRLQPLEVHDILCHVADCVVVGGVRRAAMIVLFDATDTQMLTCKHGSWWEHAPQRARSNNSAAILRNTAATQEELSGVLEACFRSGSGEPGAYLTNDLEMGTNPCVEIALRNKQMCNLTEVNVGACVTASDLIHAAEAASIIGTLQASYTHFPFIQPQWQANCEEEALLGVSLTGLADNWELVADGKALRLAVEKVKEANLLWAGRLGINPAARLTCVKPSGTTSAYLGVSSGIHAAHAPYYLRRIRVETGSVIARELVARYGLAPACSGALVERDAFNPDNIVVGVPVNRATSLVRHQESAVALLERSKHIYENWIAPGHRQGSNTHNVSLTVSYRPSEEEDVARWMAANTQAYNGISLLPYDGGSYQQMPFEEISQEEYHRLSALLPRDFSLSSLNYSATPDSRSQEWACSGASCELE